ncbi:MAG: uroporphyrinogen-III synthase [Saccharolobus sp.]
MKVLFLRPESLSEFDPIGYLTLIPKNLEIINIPLFKIKCLPYTLPDIKTYEAVAFTSQNAIICFKHMNMIKSHKIYAIGDETADILRRLYNINPIIPDVFTSIALAKKILMDNINSIISIRSKKASNDMEKILKDKIRYDEIHVYDVDVIDENVSKVRYLLENCKIDALALTSSYIAKLVAQYINPECKMKIFSIGPVTTRAITEIKSGIKIIESKTHSIKGIIESILLEMRGNG